MTLGSANGERVSGNVAERQEVPAAEATGTSGA